MSRGRSEDRQEEGRALATARALPVSALRHPERPSRTVRLRDDAYRPNASEVRTLATVGTFRIVPVRDLGAARGHQHGDGNARRLLQAGLLERQTLMIGGRSVPVVALTADGKSALEAAQGHGGDVGQRYHAGFVKPREAAHDAQLHAMYTAEAQRIEAEGGQPTRVVLDYELKREYQAFLHRADRPADETVEDARETFAAAAQLPIVEGHLELPDLRIEYEDADGRLQVRDLELVTEHYSRSQLAGKAKAGFVAYRSGSRPAGANAKTGGTPYDPHYLEWLG